MKSIFYTSEKLLEGWFTIEMAFKKLNTYKTLRRVRLIE